MLKGRLETHGQPHGDILSLTLLGTAITTGKHRFGNVFGASVRNDKVTQDLEVEVRIEAPGILQTQLMHERFTDAINTARGFQNPTFNHGAVDVIEVDIVALQRSDLDPHWDQQGAWVGVGGVDPRVQCVPDTIVPGTKDGTKKLGAAESSGPGGVTTSRSPTKIESVSGEKNGEPPISVIERSGKVLNPPRSLSVTSSSPVPNMIPAYGRNGPRSTCTAATSPKDAMS